MVIQSCSTVKRSGGISRPSCLLASAGCCRFMGGCGKVPRKAGQEADIWAIRHLVVAMLSLSEWGGISGHGATRNDLARASRRVSAPSQRHASRAARQCPKLFVRPNWLFSDVTLLFYLAEPTDDCLTGRQIGQSGDGLDEMDGLNRTCPGQRCAPVLKRAAAMVVWPL